MFINRQSKISVVLLLVVGLLTYGLSASAQSEYSGKLPPLIDRELFFGDPEISGSQLSPDGKFISFIKPYKGVRNIYVKGIDEPFDAARPITADSRPVPQYMWSQDSRYVLYAQDKDGDENFHIYAVNPSDMPEKKTGVPPARDLTDIKGIQASIYSVPKKRPNEIIIGLNDRDPSYHDVYRLNLTTGARELLIKNTEKVADFTFDLDGNVRLATRQMEDGGTEILRIDGDKYTRVAQCTFEETLNISQFHKDGKRVYMVTNKGEDVDLSRLILFNPQTGKEEFIESDPEGEVDFAGAVFAPDTDELVLTAYVGDRTRIYPREKRTKKAIDLLRNKFPKAELSVSSITLDFRFFLVIAHSDIDPGTVYLFDRISGDINFLYQQRPELNSEHLAFMKPVRYKARDGVEIPAYLTTPRGVVPKNLPVVIFPHGGPWSRDTWGYGAYTQYLANRGYAIFQPNFRGSTGYGKEFLNAGNKEWGTGVMQHDITDGVKYLVDQGIADPKRIGIFGGSYGGYATLAGLAFTPDLYRAGISYVGPSNLITLLKSVPPYWAPMLKMFHKRLGDPDDPKDQERLIRQSPLFSADKIKAPLLVIQGANDPRVKKAESDQIVVALRDRGRDVEYLLAEDEGHGFRSPENSIAVAAAMETFFAKQLGGRMQKEMSDDLSAKLAALMVDIETVTLPDMSGSALAETAPLPRRNADLIQPLDLGYTTVIETGGQKIETQVDIKVEDVELDGVPAWRIVSSAQSPMGNTLDTFFIDKQSLLPIKRNAQQGQVVIETEYGAERIKGKILAGSQEIPIDVTPAAPVLGDGSALEVALVALPLAQNYETTFRFFEPSTMKVRLMSLKVSAIETVVVKAGTFESFKVELSPIDGELGGSSILYISKNAPRCVVRSEAKLPAMAGGGTVVTELQRIGTIGTE